MAEGGYQRTILKMGCIKSSKVNGWFICKKKKNSWNSLELANTTTINVPAIEQTLGKTFPQNSHLLHTMILWSKSYGYESTNKSYKLDKVWIVDLRTES